MPPENLSSPEPTPGNLALYAMVALDIPLHQTYTYQIPDSLLKQLKRGHCVQVGFGSQLKSGIVMAIIDTLPKGLNPKKIRPIEGLVDPDPLIDKALLELLEWMARYYFAPIGEVIQLAVPAAFKLAGLRRFSLSEEGQKRLTTSEEKSFQLLSVILANKLLTFSEIKSQCTKIRYKDLLALEESGDLKTDYRITRASTKIKKTLKIQLSPKAQLLLSSNPRLGSKQREVIQLLKTQTTVMFEQLKSELGVDRQVINRLVKKQLITTSEVEIYRDPFGQDGIEERKDITLTKGQKDSLEALIEGIKAEKFRPFLLHGVTGSGKTEVYIRAIKQTLKQNRSALVLLPEIGLTPQFVAIFRGHFGTKIAVLHSGLTRGEKFDQWRKIRRQEVPIVIGARSAVFAPLNNIGLIIVDEEHDNSFKQDDKVRYNARDLAILRAQQSQGVIVLGSATPSLETYHNSQTGKYAKLEIADRVADRAMPIVEIVDMRRRKRGSDEEIPTFSPRLVELLREITERKEQAIIFLNRRGFSPFLQCDACGEVIRCIQCSVSLTYHKKRNVLQCHYCDFLRPVPGQCPDCKNPQLNYMSIGTEKLQQELCEILPGCQIGRLDRDTSGRNKTRKIIDSFRNHRFDILVGTQMVTKGHDFPLVTLVGVIQADLSLNFPDFRSAEKTFQLLTQVAGRAGRGQLPGRVLIQTFSPWHYSLRNARSHDYHGFAKAELQNRQELDYPPFGFLISLRFEGEDPTATLHAATQISAFLKQQARQVPAWSEVRVLGPSVAPLAMIKGRTRFLSLIKSSTRSPLRSLLKSTLDNFDQIFEPNLLKGLRFIIDVDPQNLL